VFDYIDKIKVHKCEELKLERGREVYNKKNKSTTVAKKEYSKTKTIEPQNSNNDEWESF